MICLVFRPVLSDAFVAQNPKQFDTSNFLRCIPVCKYTVL